MRYDIGMKRTTVMLSDEVDAQLRFAARRRRVSVARLIREAVERYVPVSSHKAWSEFIGSGQGNPEDASERVDEFVRRAIDDEFESIGR